MRRRAHSLASQKTSAADRSGVKMMGDSMFHEDDTFDFYEEIMALAEEFCQGWLERKGPFESELHGALVLNFALCTIKHDLEGLLDQLEWRPVFKGLSPREVYERGGFGDEPPKGLSQRDVIELVQQALLHMRRN